MAQAVGSSLLRQRLEKSRSAALCALYLSPQWLDCLQSAPISAPSQLFTPRGSAPQRGRYQGFISRIIAQGFQAVRRTTLIKISKSENAIQNLIRSVWP